MHRQRKYTSTPKGKADTYSVEADNAELRPYLARFARQSYCFFQRLYALKCAHRLFVHAFNIGSFISNAF